MATGSTTKVVAVVIVACLMVHTTTCMQPGPSGTETEVEDTFLKGVNEMLDVMDRNVDPCDDFYRYACGNWPKRHPVLNGRLLVDKNTVMDADLSNKLEDLLAEDIKAEDGKAIALAKTLYRSCMDESQIDKRGAEPLIRLLNEKFGGWPLLQTSSTPAEASSSGGSSSQGPAQPGTEWIRIMGTLMTFNDEAIIGQSVNARQKGHQEYAIHLYPASLSMSLDQYYAGPPLKDTKEEFFIKSALKSNPNLETYGKYILRTAQWLGANNENLQSDVIEIIEFEIRLARILKSAERRSLLIPSAKTLTKLKSSMPAINWDIYFQYSLPGLELSPDEPIELNGSTIISAILDLVAYSTSEKTVINYLLWRFVMNRMDTLGTQFVESKQHFEAEISGSPEFKTSRNQVCLDLLNSNMGLAVSSLYAKRYFNAESKKEAKTMVDSIHAQVSNVLMNAAWMDETTQALVSDKSSLMLQNIGSPRRIPNRLIREYQRLEFSPDHFFNNVINILKLNVELSQSKLGEASKRDEWILSPRDGQVSYSVAKNLISLPTGALQPPQFHPRYPKSLNYGAIGSIIGHEMSRAFHSEGLDYDHQCHLRKWWFGTRSARQFNDQTQCLVEQYDLYSAEIGGKVVKVDGTRALPQSMSDIAGVRTALLAYARRTRGREDIVPFLELTHYQMFFIKFAQNFCQNLPQHSLPDALKDSPNPFGKFRVMGTLSNLREFSDVFGCPAGSPMNPVKKCKVW